MLLGVSVNLGPDSYEIIPESHLMYTFDHDLDQVFEGHKKDSIFNLNRRIGPFPKRFYYILIVIIRERKRTQSSIGLALWPLLSSCRKAGG